MWKLFFIIMIYETFIGFGFIVTLRHFMIVVKNQFYYLDIHVFILFIIKIIV